MTGRLIGLEIRTLAGWLAHTRLLWWILVLAVAAPVGVVAVATIREGPLPWLVWAPILCLLPTSLVWAYAGYRRAAADVGTLRPVWIISGTGAWVAELSGIGVVSGAAALLLAAGVVAVTASAMQSWADAGDLAAMVWVDFALLWGFGAWVGSWWPGPAGMAAVVGVPLAGVVANTALLLRSASPGWILGTALTALTPWTVLAGAGSDTWGFGGFAGLFHAVMGLMAAATVLCVGASLRLRLNLPDRGWRMRGPVAAATLALLALALSAAWRPASPSPTPPVEAVAQPAVAGEQIVLKVGPSGTVAAEAVIRPAATLAHLWLNPALAVSAVILNGRPVAFHRVGGYIRVAGGGARSGVVVVRYGGLVDQWAWSASARSPITTAFASGAGAYLPAGSWYPVVPPDPSQVNTPPVARYSVRVRSPWPVVESNLGRLGPRPATRATTGVTLVAGTLAPVVSHGLTLWAGPSERATLERGYRRMGLLLPYGVSHQPTPGTLRAEAAGVAVRRLNAVDLVFGSVPSGLVALDNPNPIGDPVEPFVGSGTPPWMPAIAVAFTANPATSILFTEGVDQMALLWSAISPHWTRIASFDRPWAANQRPADMVLLWLLSRWPGLAGGGSLVGGPFPPQQQALAGLTPAQVQGLWRQLAEAAAHGHWPTARQVAQWRGEARREAAHG